MSHFPHEVAATAELAIARAALRAARTVQPKGARASAGEKE
jgi:hypothetical protein